MAGGKGKSIGGKATGAKDSGSKTQKSHSAKAGLQVRNRDLFISIEMAQYNIIRDAGAEVRRALVRLTTSAQSR